MEKEKDQSATHADKNKPHHVASESETNTRAKTEPLKEEEVRPLDKKEGNLDHGETGGGMGKQ